MPQDKKHRKRAAQVARNLTDEDIRRSVANEQRAVRAAGFNRTDPAASERGRSQKGATARVLGKLASTIGTEDVEQAVRLQRHVSRIKDSPGNNLEVK